MTRPRKVLSFGCEARSRCIAHQIPATKLPDQDTALPPPPQHSTCPSPEPQLPALQVPVFYSLLNPLPGVYHQWQSPTDETPPTSTSPKAHDPPECQSTALAPPTHQSALLHVTSISPLPYSLHSPIIFSPPIPLPVFIIRGSPLPTQHHSQVLP